MNFLSYCNKGIQTLRFQILSRMAPVILMEKKLSMEITR